MNKCIKCGSYAFNLYKDGIDQGGFCDVHYWQGRAHRAEASEQPIIAWAVMKGDELLSVRRFEPRPTGEAQGVEFVPLVRKITEAV